MFKCSEPCWRLETYRLFAPIGSVHDGHHITELLILAHTKKTLYSHSPRKYTCSNRIFRSPLPLPSGTYTSYALHLFRGAQIQGVWSPVRLNFVSWRVIFSTQLLQFSILTNKNVYQFTQPSRKRQITVTVKVHPQCGILTWQIRFFGKSVDLWSILCTLMVKLRGLSPRANYTDRVAADGRRS